MIIFSRQGGSFSHIGDRIGCSFKPAMYKIPLTYHNGMHSSYSCTGKHSNHQLNDHWHVDCNTVSFLDAYKKQCNEFLFYIIDLL